MPVVLHRSLEAALLLDNCLYGYCKVIQATGSALVKVYALCSGLKTGISGDRKLFDNVAFIIKYIMLKSRFSTELFLKGC